MTARHRISKMLLRHGRVYPKPTTWRQDHRRWLAGQHFEEPTSELVYLNLLAQVDALTGRKLQLAQQVAQLATDERWWPTVARLRSFRAIDTLSALSIHLELGADWARFEKAPRVGVAGTDAISQPVRGEQNPGLDHEDRIDPGDDCSSKRHAWAATPCRAHVGGPPARPARARTPDRQQGTAPPSSRLPTAQSPRQTARRGHRRVAASWRASLGCRYSQLAAADIPTFGRPGRRAVKRSGTRDSPMSHNAQGCDARS